MPTDNDNHRPRTERIRPALLHVRRPRAWVPVVAYTITISAVTATHLLGDRAASRRDHYRELGNDVQVPFEDRVRYINESNRSNQEAYRYVIGSAVARGLWAATVCLHLAYELYQIPGTGERRSARGTERENFRQSYIRYDTPSPSSEI